MPEDSSSHSGEQPSPVSEEPQPVPEEPRPAPSTESPSATERPVHGAAEARASAAPPVEPADAAPFEAPHFEQARAASGASAIDLLDDVELEVKIELGRTEMYIEDVLGLGPGSVVELNKAAGDPVDILVNERLVARGEVLVLNDNFCVRINDIVSPVPELEQDS
jgi:flagellar motor switch protein FliN/FliY